MKSIPERSYQDLAASRLFSSFAVHEIRDLLNKVRCDFRSYHKDALVAFRGDAYDRLLLLTRGTLVAEIVDQKGVSLTVENLAGPLPVATGILFAGEAILPVQLRAETDAEVISLSRQSVLDLCRHDERFLLSYLRDSGDKIAFLAEKIRLLRFTTIRQKIAVYFLDLAGRQGSGRLSLPHSLDTVADIFGVTRPALSRCLSQLVDENLLQRDGRDYIIASPEGLKDLLEE
jgi:CRP/FNR family transcriptional regulator, dissimilatory nitrate respiration regulator